MDTTPNAAQSAFTATPATISADGVDDAALASTWKNAAGTALAGKSVTYSMLDGTPDVEFSSLAWSQGSVATNTQVTLTITLRNAAGVAIAYLPAAHIPVAVSGTGNTLGTVSATNGSGVATVTFESSASGTKTASLTVGGVTLSTAGLTVTGVSAAISGTFASGTTAANVVSGGRTIIITLTGDTWVASGATFNAQRQAIIDGIDSAQSEANGWDAERSNIAVTDVVRTSDTVVTITLPALGDYAITSNETLTVTVPGAALTGASPIVASPSIVISTGSISFVFSSDWLTATGRTNSAITDGGAFDGQACGDQSSVGNPSGIIVTADSLSAPSALSGLNAFQLAMVGSDCCMIQANDALPISTTHWGQFWVVNNENATKNDHPVAYHNIHGSDPIQAVPWQRYGNVGGSAWQMGVPGAGSYPYNRFYSPNLTLGAWYRYEWMMEYLTATTFRFYPRIYNASGTLLYDVNNYTAEGGTTLQEWYDVPNVLTLGGDGSASAQELARNFGIGNEGPDGAPDNDLTWSYAGLRLSTDGWIGGAL